MQTDQGKTVHQGRNVKRIREILGIKQEALAMDLGISQQAISQLEQKEALDREMLEKVSKSLRVSAEAIEKFNEEAAFNIVAHDTHDHSASVNYYCTFNPIDKLMEAMDENKKLYEALLKSEREKITLLEKMLAL
jgi:transcriptional regulator with XRE-family HTH domain